MKIAAIVLAAGQSRRMGEVNKLTVDVDGVPMVRRVVQTALEAGLSPISVVLGHAADEVREVLAGLDCRFVTNDRHDEGMGTSVASGVRATPPDAHAVFVLLGDMPWVRRDDLHALARAFEDGPTCAAVVPAMGGQRGNPVLWSLEHRAELEALRGDRGARGLLERHADTVVTVPVEHRGVLRDVDTMGELLRLDSGTE